MRYLLVVVPLFAVAGCIQAIQCRTDNDCNALEYCYKLALDPESAEGTEPGFPYEEFGTCTSDCTSDSDCYGSARCTPQGICKDLSLNADRQWGGYEPGLAEILATSAYAPMMNCSTFIECMLECESDRTTCNRCLLQVDPPSLPLAKPLWDCLLSNNGIAASFAIRMNNECENEKAMCQEDR